MALAIYPYSYYLYDFIDYLVKNPLFQEIERCPRVINKILWSGHER